MIDTNPTNPTNPTAVSASVPVVLGDLLARYQTITGLRALADFLDANPDLPVPSCRWNLQVFTGNMHDVSCDQAARAEIARVAALLGVVPVDRTDQGGHLTVSKTFDRITYELVHIPARRMAEHAAETSYRANIRASLTTDNTHSSDEAEQGWAA